MPTVKKQRPPQINNLMMHLKFLEKQEQTKPKTSRWRETIKIRAKINEIEIKKKKLYKESMKQKVDSLKRLTLSQHDKMEEGEDPN
jgi:hypothetical protein